VESTSCIVKALFFANLDSSDSKMFGLQVQRPRDPTAVRRTS
jgi:hypothetical protein